MSEAARPTFSGPSAVETTPDRTAVLSPTDVARTVDRMAHQIIEPEEAQSGLVVIGIRRGGESLARRLV